MGEHFLERRNETRLLVLQQAGAERGRRKKDREEKFVKSSVNERLDEPPVEPADEPRDAPAKLGKRARAPRKEDDMATTVSTSALAILFACDSGERLRREKFQEFVNLRQDPQAGFATERERNYFSGRSPFFWLRLARGLAESECAGEKDRRWCKHVRKASADRACARVLDGPLRRRFASLDPARGKPVRQTLRSTKTGRWKRETKQNARFSASLRSAARETVGR